MLSPIGLSMLLATSVIAQSTITRTAVPTKSTHKTCITALASTKVEQVPTTSTTITLVPSTRYQTSTSSPVVFVEPEPTARTVTITTTVLYTGPSESNKFYATSTEWVTETPVMITSTVTKTSTLKAVTETAFTTSLVPTPLGFIGVEESSGERDYPGDDASSALSAASVSSQSSADSVVSASPASSASLSSAASASSSIASEVSLVESVILTKISSLYISASSSAESVASSVSAVSSSANSVASSASSVASSASEMAPAFSLSPRSGPLNSKKARHFIAGGAVIRRDGLNMMAAKFFPRAVACTREVKMVYIVNVIVVQPARTATLDIPAKEGSSSVMVTSTSTINPAQMSATVTFFTTMTMTQTGTLTETALVTETPTPAYEKYIDTQYAACVNDTNQLGPRNSKGNYLSYVVLTGYSQIFMINDVKTPRDCCTACWDNTYCQFSHFVSTTDTCFIYGGAGDVCLNPGFLTAYFTETAQPNKEMSVFSNGPCGVVDSQ